MHSVTGKCVSARAGANATKIVLPSDEENREAFRLERAARCACSGNLANELIGLRHHSAVFILRFHIFVNY